MILQKILKISLTLVIFLVWVPLVLAAPPTTGPGQGESSQAYTVQPGDTLVLIALRHHLTLADIIQANNLLNPNLILPGQSLILPGVSAGVATSLPADAGTYIVRPGETLFNIATRYGVTVDELVVANGLSNPDVIQVGQSLRIPGEPAPVVPIYPAPFVTIDLSEPTIIQGRTLVVKVVLSEPLVGLAGTFDGRPVLFQPDRSQPPSGRSFWGLVALHPLAEPGVIPIMLTATLPDGSAVTTQAGVNLVEGPYGREHIEVDNRRGELLAPEILRRERELLSDLWSQVSSQPRWEGPFHYPVDASSLRITSFFGTRRSYNNNSELSFHEGVDFGGGVGRPVYAVATGRVVLAQSLAVRGNAVLIDHGLGLFSAYWHQSQLVVVEGQEVQAGDLIGYIGDTGLVTGPHLHWEVRLNGIAVEPMQWVQQVIP